MCVMTEDRPDLKLLMYSLAPDFSFWAEGDNIQSIPRFYICRFNQLRIKNIQEGKKSKEFPKAKLEFAASIYTAFTLYWVLLAI